MVAEGNSKMNAVIEMDFYSEMKDSLKKWVFADKEVLKLFPRKIKYAQKVELNSSLWSDAKLKKALPPLIRPEMKLLANRTSDAMQMIEKSPKERQKMLKAIKDGISRTQKEIEEKVSKALDDLESGKADAKAGLAMGKKAMAQVDKLDANKVFSAPLDIAIATAKSIAEAEANGKDVSAAQDAAKKEIDKAIAELNDTGKTAQNVAKYLSTNGKKMENNPKAEIATFGKLVTNKKVLDPLQRLDKAIDLMESALTDYAKKLKAGAIDRLAAKRAESDFTKMKGLNKTADAAVAAMTSVQAAFKTAEKHLK